MSVKQFKGWIARLKPAERILSPQVELEWILGAQGFGGWEPLENLFFKSVGMFGCLVCLFFEDMNAHMQTKWKPVRWGPQAFRAGTRITWAMNR